jgi:SAM-dependent methyltransferase
LLVLPRVIWYSARAPRDRVQAWDAYWRGIDRGGVGGDVLWDSATERELRRCREQALAHLDPALPVVDVACGNGTQTVVLADHFPSVVGVDVSAEAIARARQHVGDRPSVSFRVLDVTAAGAGRTLARDIGPANAHVRGLLHILDDDGRRAVAENLADIVGDRGIVLLVETAFAGGGLRYLEWLGARLTSVPQTVARCLRAGLPIPRVFDGEQLRQVFPAPRWEVLTSGTTEIEVVVSGAEGDLTTVPGYFAVLRHRPQRTSDDPALTGTDSPAATG